MLRLNHLARLRQRLTQKFSHRKTRRGWEVSQGWRLAFASLLASTTLAGPGLRAQVAAGPEPAPPAGTSAQRFSFRIAAGPLDAALEAFAHQSGLHVTLNVPAARLAALDSPGIVGEYTPQDAVRALLRNTGLTFRFRANASVEVGLHAADEVTVEATASTVSLQQFPQPLLDTAQTVATVPEYILQEQADTGLRDALRNIPGISLAAGEGGSQGDNLTIRGFSARNDIYLDGIRDFGSYYRDSFNYEAVDVLEGPAGVEFGRGSTGGVVNQETKVPQLHEHIGGNVEFGTNAMRRVSADINEPFHDQAGSAFRLNLVGEETNVAGRNYTNVRRFGIAPSLAFGLNTKTRAFLSYLHEGESDLPDYGLPYFGAGPAAVNRKTFYGYAESNFLRTNPDIVTARAEHDFGELLTVRNSLRWANYPRDVNITEPQVNTTPTYSTSGGVIYALCSPTAATPCYPVNTPLSQITVKRNQITVNSVEDMLWNQASALGHFHIGHLADDFSLIVEGGRERSRPQRPTYTYVFPSAAFVSALNPNAFDFMPAATAMGAKTYVNSQSYGIGFNDTLKPFAWLLLSGGVRFDSFNADYVSGSTHLARLDRQPNYRAAVVLKPRPDGSVYFDWGTSFNPSAESLSLSATNAVQAPQYNETYEAGAKWAFFQQHLELNGAWFQTLKTNVYETDPNNSLNVIPVGNQRVRGVQLGALGHMPRHFDLILGYAYLNGLTTDTEQNYSPFAAYYKQGDPVFGQAPFYLSAKGLPFANVPKNSANLFVTHALPWRFVGGFGFNEVSARRASSTGPIVLPFATTPTPVTQLPMAFKVIPGYWVFNAMVRRPLTDRLTLQVNVFNLTNAFFIDQPHPNHLVPSEGINAQFGLNYKF